MMKKHILLSALLIALTPTTVLAQSVYTFPPASFAPLSSHPLQPQPVWNGQPRGMIPYNYNYQQPLVRWPQSMPVPMQGYYPAYPLQPQMHNPAPLAQQGVNPANTHTQWVYASPHNPARPAHPGPKPPPPPEPEREQKPWGDTRHIWPDFYTTWTRDVWDNMINAPYDMGYMPGGWRFPSFSSPDPVTVGDAVANQFPPIMEEIPNFINF